MFIVCSLFNPGDDHVLHKEALGDEPVRTVTADNQSISIEASILFRLDKYNAPELWENIGEHFVSKIVRPIARSRLSAKFAGLRLDDVTAHRNDLERELKEELNVQFQDKGLVCEGVLLSEVKLAEKSGENKSLFSIFKKAPENT